MAWLSFSPGRTTLQQLYLTLLPCGLLLFAIGNRVSIAVPPDLAAN